MVRVFRIFVVMTLLTVAFATPATAARKVPIKGTVTGTHERVMFDEACAPAEPEEGDVWWSFHSPMISEPSPGIGIMSHLGKVEYQLTQCTMPVDEVFISEGTIKFIAANGDELYVSHTMTSSLEFDPDIPGPPIGFAMAGEWTAYGGTGRFTNSMGGGTLSGFGDIPDGMDSLGLPDGLMELDFRGKIAYKR